MTKIKIFFGAAGIALRVARKSIGDFLAMKKLRMAILSGEFFSKMRGKN